MEDDWTEQSQGSGRGRHRGGYSWRWKGGWVAWFDDMLVYNNLYITICRVSVSSMGGVVVLVQKPRSFWERL